MVLVKIILFLFLIEVVNSGKILAPDVDNYLLVTVRKDTIFKEFVDLFNFYVKIQVSCDTCIPPITDISTTAFFAGVYSLNFTGTNTTIEIEQFMNKTDFEHLYFNASKSNSSEKNCVTGCKDIEWLFNLASVLISKTKSNPETRIRKKQISLITNYYYKPGFDEVLSSTFYDKFNLTFISLFVPSTDFLDLAALEGSRIPVTVFDMSDKNLNFGQANEKFLNRFIDFDYENAVAPVAGFIEISNPNLSNGLNFFSSVFDQELCRLNNDSEFYQISLIIYYKFYQYEIDLIISNLQGYSETYLNVIVSSYINSTFLQTPINPNCSKTFYSEVVQRLKDPNLEQFNFYITDNYPKYTVYDEITSKILSPKNATKIPNHVTILDLSNPIEKGIIAKMYGICREKSFYQNLTFATFVKAETQKFDSDWVVICGILFGFGILSAIVILLLTRAHEKVRLKTFIKRTGTDRSTNVRTRMRLASTLVAASNFATEVIVEGQGPAQYPSWRICPTMLEVDYTKTLGKGSSATIYGAFLNCKAPLSKLFPSLNTQHFSKCTVAVKVSLVYGSNDSEQFNNEVKSMTILGWHPNICPFLGWSMSRDRPCLVFESIPNDLLRFVKGFRDIGFPETKDILLISWQIANGMAHIAQHKLVHRDLACRNVLLTEDLRVKITDFGLCCDCDHSYTYTGSISKRLPIKWLAPEALLDRLFSEKSDVWSFGILLYEILTCGIVPYATMSNEEMLEFLRDGKRLEAPEGSPENVVELMKSCWHSTPESRPTFVQIRDRISLILEEESATYGYLAPMDLLSSPPPKPMLQHQTSRTIIPLKQLKRHSLYPRINDEHKHSGHRMTAIRASID
uniref:Protein kinase domain-containing protein n=1 Tax=Panagrolaimus sp. PS1159 TaxID=55785 RepID=A0AC35G2Q2_9BILA